MATKNYQYIVDIAARTKNFLSGMQNVDKQVSGTSRLMKGLATTIAATFSIAVVKNFTTASIEAYKVQLQAETRLRAAMRANGNESEISFRKYQRFASGLQRVTTIGDETTLQLLQLAESMQAADPQKAVEGAIGLSKALGMDMNSAVKAATMAMEGQYTMLSRYIPGLRSATTEGERMAAVQKVMASGMAIAKAEAESTAGRIEQLTNQWGDLKEKIGEGILSSESLKQDLESWSKVLDIWQSDQLSGWQKFWSSVSKKAMNANAEILEQYRTLGPNIEDALKIQDAYNQAMGQTDEHKKLSAAIAEITKNRSAEVEQTKITTVILSDLQKLQQKGVFTYGEINDRIKEYNDLLTATDINNTRQIATIHREIEALNNKKKALDELHKPVTTTARVDNMSMLGGTMPGYTSTGEGAQGMMDMQRFIEANIEAARELQFVWVDFGTQFDTVIQGMLDGFEDITEVHMMAGTFIDSMMASAHEGAESFKEFAKNIGTAARSSINAFIAEAVAGAVSTALAKSGIPFPLNMVAGAVAAAGATTLMNTAIPKFAKGGIVTGPTVGMMGEYPGASSNPEVIAPLDRLKDLIRPAGGSTVIMPNGIEIDGYKLRILLKKVETQLNNRV